MRQVDLNADLGELEDASLDAAVMPFISSANIACGGHAGNEDSMRRTIRLAKEHGVAVGAHPGYPDPENFGRLSMEMPVADLCAEIRLQVERFQWIARSEGVAVRHVKLHGALYNDLADNYRDALEVCRMLAELDQELRVIGFSNSAFLSAAEDAGLVAIHEVFADRAYDATGRLMPRSQTGAVIHDEARCLVQVETMLLQGKVPTVDDQLVPVQVDSICVHGDNPSAIGFAGALRDFFSNHRIKVRPAADMTFSFFPLGESTLLAKLPSRISRSTHRCIRALQVALDGDKHIAELVPCYAELKIDFDSTLISCAELQRRIEALEISSLDLPEARQIEVPVRYDGEDLKRVAMHNNITEEDVVHLHSEPTYLVYMLGFSPGFAYMGGLNPVLSTPRREMPRVSVPEGAVGIAGNQTGIYPVASPGGWNIIGHTDLKLFHPDADQPFLFEAGDEVRFIPKAEFGGTTSVSFIGRDRARPSTARYLKIIRPGMYTTVQDAGRFGYQRYGLPPSGAMDRRAFASANALLGNDRHAAVLECTGTMPELEFSMPMHIAVVYADHHRVIDADGLVSFEPIRRGYRAYIAVEGGFDVPAVMGSRSTYVPGRIGGLEGRPLKAGDVLPIRDQGARLHTAEVDDLGERIRNRVRVIPGPEAGWFDCEGLNTFLNSPFAVSSKSNRTGLRLEGPALSFRSDEQMVSAGLSFGTIQVPPSGLPIIMMADHPTTGGYPRIGNVVEEDLPVLAQLRPGDAIRFREV